MDADVKLLITMRHLLHICRTFVRCCGKKRNFPYLCKYETSVFHI